MHYAYIMQLHKALLKGQSTQKYLWPFHSMEQKEIVWRMFQPFLSMQWKSNEV